MNFNLNEVVKKFKEREYLPNNFERNFIYQLLNNKFSFNYLRLKITLNLRASDRTPRVSKLF